MIEIKVSSGKPELTSLLVRQFPSGKPVWGDCRFHVNSEINSCDWWFVLHGTSLEEEQRTYCDPRNIVYVSMEPYETYPPRFYSQFQTLIACDPGLSHPSIIRKNFITWWVGISVQFKSGHVFSPCCNMNYDDLASFQSPHKQNKVSIVTSSNASLSGHKKRLRFIEFLMSSHLSSSVDFYGGGHNPVLDKLDAIAPYKYHLCLENSVIDNYWTEKIADAFLGLSLPIYHGCPNIQSYFDPESFISIDIEDPPATLDVIAAALERDEHSLRYDSILRSRDMVLNDYNIFNLMSKFATAPSERRELCVLLPPDQFSGVRPGLITRTASRVRSLKNKLFGES